MRVTVHIPDELFEQAERLAKQLQKSRSEVYADAISAYLKRLREDEVTAAVNKALKEVGDQTDPFVEEAANETLRRNEW